MEKASIQIACPKHPSETIQRVNTDIHTTQHLYCLECIVQQPNLSASRSQLKPISEFLNNAAAFYLLQKDHIRIEPEVSHQYLQALTKRNDIIDKLNSHILYQKKRIEHTFNQITQEVLDLIEKKKNEYFSILDQQMSSLRYWYIFFEKRIKKAYPTKEDIPYLFPSKEDLFNRLQKISDITELAVFIRDIKHDLNESILNRTYAQDSQNRKNIQKVRLDALSKDLAGIRKLQPVLVEKEDINDTKNKVLSYLEGIFDKLWTIENPIKDVIFKDFEIDSTICMPEDYSRLVGWLPQKYRNMTPKLLYRASRDGKDGKTFHSLCDNKGATLTFVKADSHLFGGFTEQSWNSMNNWIFDDEAFLFSLTLRLKCPLLEGYGVGALLGSSISGIYFGEGGDLVVFDEQRNSSVTQFSYQDSHKLLGRELGDNVETQQIFEPSEVEVYALTE